MLSDYTVEEIFFPTYEFVIFQILSDYTVADIVILSEDGGIEGDLIQQQPIF